MGKPQSSLGVRTASTSHESSAYHRYQTCDYVFLFTETVGIASLKGVRETVMCNHISTKGQKSLHFGSRGHSQHRGQNLIPIQQCWEVVRKYGERKRRSVPDKWP